MRDEASVRAMFDRFDKAADGDVSIETGAVYETLLWLLHEDMNDVTILTYLPEE